jgi:hypothetical protein
MARLASRLTWVVDGRVQAGKHVGGLDDQIDLIGRA